MVEYRKRRPRTSPPRVDETRSSLAARRRDRSKRTWLLVAAVCVAVTAAGLAGARWLPLIGRRDQTSATTSTVPATTTADATATATDSRTPVATPADSTESTSQPDEIVIGWVGDTTPGSKYGNPPDTGRALFKHTREFTVAPDIMVANLEGTYGSGGPSKCDGKDSSECYAFQAPVKYAAALGWAGFDVVNLANNHSRDYLDQGLRSTRKALEANDIAYTGLSDGATIKEIDGVRVAFIGFSPYSWSPSIGDLEKARSLVQEAESQADIVVVLMHAGAEGADKTRTPKGAEKAYGEFRGDSRAFSHAVIDAGADLVLGSGPHVIRGMEEYRGRLIAYSLGNFAGWKNFGRSGKLALSGLLTVRMAPDGRVLGGTWRSLRIADPGVPKPDPRNESLKLVRELSEEDFDSGVSPAEDGTFSIPSE